MRYWVVQVTRATCANQRSGPARAVSLCAFLGLATACGGRLNAGWDQPRGLLPVDARNPVVLGVDGPYDNWLGEYAMLLASTRGPLLGGIIVNESPAGNLDDSMAGWQQMVSAARESGLPSIPEPLASTGTVLVRPSDATIDSTVPNDSEGARFIIETSQRLAEPDLPLVVVTGGRLTDVADAYLVDHTVTDRVVVVSALGSASEDGGKMGIPNGEMDTWADVIVAQKFRYVQVSGYYDQKADVPDNLLPQLPDNPFTSWVRAKQLQVYDDLDACDQVGILAVAVPSFVLAVERVVQGDTGTDDIPTLSGDPDGPIWLVTRVDGSVATESFQQMLVDPATFQTE